jgi:hypothetical protein
LLRSCGLRSRRLLELWCDTGSFRVRLVNWHRHWPPVDGPDGCPAGSQPAGPSGSEGSPGSQGQGRLTRK